MELNDAWPVVKLPRGCNAALGVELELTLKLSDVCARGHSLPTLLSKEPLPSHSGAKTISKSKGQISSLPVSKKACGLGDQKRFVEILILSD